MQNFDLMICSVSFQSRPYLELNIELTRRLNPLIEANWLIVENTPPNENGRFDPGLERVVLIEGCKFDVSKDRPASFNHASALNIALEHVDTNYLFIIDPDFFVIRPNWLSDIVQHMHINDLSFFGVPWHPKWFGKYRYFPCVHFLVINLNKIKKESLNFVPEESPKDKGEKLKRIKKILPGPIRSALHQLLLLDRRYIGTSHDTGFHIYKKFINSLEHKYETAVPVFKPNHDLKFFNSRLSILHKGLEVLLPDQVCFIPKKERYFTEQGFADLGLIDVRANNWEEFFWKNNPFGFHIRSYVQEKRPIDEEINALRLIIDSLINSSFYKSEFQRIQVD